MVTSDGRSGIPRVFGVLSIVFAGITLMGGLMGGCSGLAGVAMGSFGSSLPSEQRPMIEAMASLYSGFGLISLILIAMSGALLAIGIGQLRYRQWARRWSIHWGITAIVAIAVMVAISALVIGPGYKRMFDAIAAQQSLHSDKRMPDVSGAIGWLASGAFGFQLVFVYLPYPVLLLAMFTRPRVHQAMTE